MKKCKTCKYWNHQAFGIGNCSGITSSSMVIPIPNQPKGNPNGKLITVRSGLITDASFLKTAKDWNCKNWSRK